MKKRPASGKMKKRLFRSSATSMVSISLVLVLLGALLIILINAGQLSDYVREQVGFTLVLHDNIKESDILSLIHIFQLAEKYLITGYFDDSEWWVDVGKPEDLAAARQFFESQAKKSF